MKDWQYSRNVTVRLTSGAFQNIVLPARLDNVEEIRLDEFLITGFNGGVSASFYLRLQTDNVNTGTINNESNSGLLVPVDVLNPHVIYQRPRVIGVANLATVNHFQLTLAMPNGSNVTLIEASFVLTFVMRKGPEALEENRRLNAMARAPPNITAIRNSYNLGNGSVI